MINKFSVKTTIFSGKEALSVLARYANERVAIITDAFIVKSGLVEKVTRYLNQVRIFDQVKPDPDVNVVKQGTAQIADFAPTVFIALGGGSALDACKGIRATYELLTHSSHLPLIAIPTTSGSGSEVTSYAVISDPVEQVKHPLVSDSLLANVAILDAELVMSVPPAISADTGMDVLTHAIEAYVSTKANDFSDALAEKTIELVHRFLPRVYHAPQDALAREKVHNAACMAGMAFTSSGLGLVHGMAHTLGALFHIPHGKINAMLLPIIIEFNATKSEIARQRYARCAQLMGLAFQSGQCPVAQFVAEIRRLNRVFNIPENLTDLSKDIGFLQQNRTHLIRAILNDGCTQTNPYAVSFDDVDGLLHRIEGTK